MDVFFFFKQKTAYEITTGDWSSDVCSSNLSPTMREFAADPQTTVHPQTVIEHFGSWNSAKRAAGLVPRRFATRSELLGLLRELGEELSRLPTARDIDDRK